MCKSWTNSAIFLVSSNTYLLVKGKQFPSHLFDSQSLVIQEKKYTTQLNEGLALQVALGLGILRPEA